MIIILDGWGEQIPDQFNGINVAPTPTMDELKKVVNAGFSQCCEVEVGSLCLFNCMLMT